MGISANGQTRPPMDASVKPTHVLSKDNHMISAAANKMQASMLSATPALYISALISMNSTSALLKNKAMLLVNTTTYQKNQVREAEQVATYSKLTATFSRLPSGTFEDALSSKKSCSNPTVQ